MNETLEKLIAERTRELTEINRQLQTEIAERRKAEDVLWHTQKMEAIGELTGGIAHDFNNLLHVVVLSMEMIRGAVENDGEIPRPKILRLLTTSKAATDRATKLTRQLLAFARRETMQLGVVTLDEVIVGCEPFLRRALGETTTLKLSFEPGLWPNRIDAAQFETALLNLVVNARDAMASGGQLEIATSNAEIDATQAGGMDGLAPGSFVLVRVADTGTGMTPEVAAHAFEPFFTTKDVGKGTGLGLSQVYGFIRQSGGHISIDTQLGRGTTFHLYLPRCEQLPSIIQTEVVPTHAPPTGNETILVVEDNPEVLELATATIRGLGYRVLTAVDGPSALGIIATDQEIDLLISDIVMPVGMNGFELISQARAVRGKLKALATSGYANVHRPGSARPDVPLLLKPYNLADLAKCVRQALDQP
jgi:signal transduction histidine kinase